MGMDNRIIGVDFFSFIKIPHELKRNGFGERK